MSNTVEGYQDTMTKIQNALHFQGMRVNSVTRTIQGVHIQVEDWIDVPEYDLHQENDDKILQSVRDFVIEHYAKTGFTDQKIRAIVDGQFNIGKIANIQLTIPVSDEKAQEILDLDLQITQSLQEAEQLQKQADALMNKATELRQTAYNLSYGGVQ